MQHRCPAEGRIQKGESVIALRPALIRGMCAGQASLYLFIIQILGHLFIQNMAGNELAILFNPPNHGFRKTQ
jgi:hypothetical protein